MTNLLSIRDWGDIRPIGGFNLFLADPAWPSISNSKAKPGKSVYGQYDTMTMAEICAIPVKEMSADDALLLLWVTSPYAEKAFKVVKAWGFSYRSSLTWPKNTATHGYWARGQHETVYICRRGKFPCPTPTLFPTSIIPGKTRGHSRKPDWLHERVEAILPETRRVEMNARCGRPGWSSIGFETAKFDQPKEDAP